MRRSMLFILALLAGCSGAEPVQERGPRTASLDVLVWSVHGQRPVAAEGTLTSRADGNRREFNTRANPAQGTSITGLPPGAYRITITRRFDPTGRPQRVEGIEEIYLEPGARAQVTVVVTDREGELGRVPTSTGGAFPLKDPSSTAAAPSHLPLRALHPLGPS
ncbi:MAG: hypothetical protein KF878_31090 [Planctomycetes bacterium]|nr:hypothetical protein [Planctomycetota bacterium]